MATRTINTKIQLDGEKEFKQAISSINSGLGVLNSEMKKTTAQYKDNADSVEALKAKGDVLERQLSSQKEKLETIRQALKNAAEQYGESDKRTMQWQKTLNETEAAIYNTESAIKENNSALENAGQKGNALSGIINGLVDKFGDKLPAGVKETLTSISGFSTGAVAAVGAVTVAVTALITTYKKLFEIVKEQAAEAGELEDIAQIIGLDVETVQEYQYASELIGTSFDTIQGSMTKLKRNMQSAQEGNEDLIEQFKKLGVEVENADGTLRDSEDTFWDVINALGEIENVTDRDTIAMDLMGKSAEDLNPIIVQGQEAFEDYRKEAEELNTVMSEDTVSALAAVDDAYLRLQETQDGIKEQISGEMAPAVEDFYGSWTELTKAAGEALIDSGIIDTLGDILTVVNSIIDVITAIVQTTFPSLTSGFDSIEEVAYKVGLRLATFVDTLKTLVNIANPLVGWYNYLNGGSYISTETTEAYISNARSSTDGFTYDSSTGLYSGNYYANASGDYNFVGGRTIVGENGPEMVTLPQGSQISTAQDTSAMGNTTFNITIDAKNVREFNDIVRIAKNSRVSARMRG